MKCSQPCTWTCSQRRAAHRLACPSLEPSTQERKPECGPSSSPSPLNSCDAGHEDFESTPDGPRCSPFIAAMSVGRVLSATHPGYDSLLTPSTPHPAPPSLHPTSHLPPPSLLQPDSDWSKVLPKGATAVLRPSPAPPTGKEEQVSWAAAQNSITVAGR